MAPHTVAAEDGGSDAGQQEPDRAYLERSGSEAASSGTLLAAAVGRTEQYVKEQSGNARSFSLDSPKSRAPRIQVLRKAAG